MDVREKQSIKKRLIDADALLDGFLKRYTERERDGNFVFAACEIKQDFADMISNFHTVDAVPVVRCKDCDVPHNKWTGCPKMNGLIPPPEHFCSYGERKEGAD